MFKNLFKMGVVVAKGNQEGVRPTAPPPWEKNERPDSKQEPPLVQLSKRYETSLNDTKQAIVEFTDTLVELLREVIPDIKSEPIYGLNWRDLNCIYLHSFAKLCQYSVSHIRTNALEDVICSVLNEYGIKRPYVRAPFICLSEEEKDKVISILRKALSSQGNDGAGE